MHNLLSNLATCRKLRYMCYLVPGVVMISVIGIGFTWVILWSAWVGLSCYELCNLGGDCADNRAGI